MNNNNFTDIYNNKNPNNEIDRISQLELQGNGISFDLIFDFKKFKLPYINTIGIIFKNINIKKVCYIDNEVINELSFINVYWTRIDSTLLKDLKNLDYVRIERNNISRIYNDTFKHNTLLTKVYLIHNMIVHIEVCAFVILKDLKELYLSNNYLLNLNIKLFLKIPIHTIRIVKNKLDTIKSELFNYYSYRIIDLSYNNITSIERNAFGGKLWELYLNNNQLSTIDISIFSTLSNQLIHFDIFDNKITCNCNKLDWIYNYMTLLRNTHRNDLSKIKCHQFKINVLVFKEIFNCTYNKG